VQVNYALTVDSWTLNLSQQQTTVWFVVTNKPASADRMRLLLCCAAVGLIGIWLAYGLFTACPNIIFMMLSCVIISSAVFFFAEWLSLVSTGLQWC
jgi:hypothetical protein